MPGNFFFLMFCSNTKMWLWISHSFCPSEEWTFYFHNPGVTKWTSLPSKTCADTIPSPLLVSVKFQSRWILSSHALFCQKTFIVYQFKTSNSWLRREYAFAAQEKACFRFQSTWHNSVTSKTTNYSAIMKPSGTRILWVSSHSDNWWLDDEVQKENSPSVTCFCDTQFFRQETGR